MDNLLKRGWMGDQMCVIYANGSETVDYLFTRCIFSIFLLVMLLILRRIESAEDNRVIL